MKAGDTEAMGEGEVSVTQVEAAGERKGGVGAALIRSLAALLPPAVPKTKSAQSHDSHPADWMAALTIPHPRPRSE